MNEDFAFFRRESEAISADEFKRLDTPEVIGQELILNIKGWIAEALATLGRHTGTMPAVDLIAPDWIDLSLPDHAIHEFCRVCNQLPKYMPAANILDLFDQDEKNAVELLYRIRQLNDTMFGLNTPASSAVIIIKASLGLGVMAAVAHVNPWESFAATQHKAQTALINSNRGTPPESANALRAEDAKPEHRRWILAAKGYWAKYDRLSPKQIAEKLKVELELTHSIDWIRKVIAPAKPKK